jgi:hypothetical protein
VFKHRVFVFVTRSSGMPPCCWPTLYAAGRKLHPHSIRNHLHLPFASLCCRHIRTFHLIVLPLKETISCIASNARHVALTSFLTGDNAVTAA